jgi:hypothetical protein
MKQFALAALAVLVVGCGGSLKDKIVGVWHMDAESVSGSAVGEAKSSPTWPQMKKNLEQGTFTFGADGKLTAAAFGQSGDAGTWKLDANKIVITSNKPDKQSQVPIFTVAADGSKIHMAAPGGTFEADLVKAK